MDEVVAEARESGREVAVEERPLIGVTLMVDRAVRDDHVPRYGMNRSYFAAIRHAGGVPIPLAPGSPDEMRLYGSALPLDGLCLTGGGDLDPFYYAEERRAGCHVPDDERDAMEIVLLASARKSGLPILAICRGIQVLNAAWGGTLIQDIADECPQAGQHSFAQGHPRDYLAHEIYIERDSLLHTLIGAPSCRVNSLHHQAVAAVAPGLRATAQAPDGIIEALELADEAQRGQASVSAPTGVDPAVQRGQRFVLAVQFHPEDLQALAPMRRLFQGFIAAARRYRAQRA